MSHNNNKHVLSRMKMAKNTKINELNLKMKLLVTLQLEFTYTHIDTYANNNNKTNNLLCSFFSKRTPDDNNAF